MGKLIFVLGGARSGKSDYSQTLAEKMARECVYVATAQAGDEEMAARIKAHQASRGGQWHTIEAPLQTAQAVRRAEQDGEVYLLDCLTLLASNVLFEHEGKSADSVEEALQSELDELLELVRGQEKTWIVVSNEVGLGIVPAYESARLYRDLLGRANQFMAAAADVVVFLAAGLPIFLKGSLAQESGAI